MENYGHKVKAYKEAASTVGVAESTIRAWVREFEMMEYVIADSKRGKHSKTASPILNDPDFREEFKNYVKTSSCEKGNRYLE